MPMLCILCLMLCLPLTTWAAEDYEHRVDQVLLQTPLVDGHNDLPWEIRERFKSDVAALNLAAGTSHLPLEAGQAALMTDIPRLRAGHVGAQFWSVWIPVSAQGFEAVQMTLEQIDLVKRMTAQYPADLQRCGHSTHPQEPQNRLADRHRGRPPDQ
jgi:membrane dipeptidase